MVIMFKCHRSTYTVALGIPPSYECHMTKVDRHCCSPAVNLVHCILIDHKVMGFRLTVNVFTSRSL